MKVSEMFQVCDLYRTRIITSQEEASMCIEISLTNLHHHILVWVQDTLRVKHLLDLFHQLDTRR